MHSAELPPPAKEVHDFILYGHSTNCFAGEFRYQSNFELVTFFSCKGKPQSDGKPKIEGEFRRYHVILATLFATFLLQRMNDVLVAENEEVKVAFVLSLHLFTTCFSA